MPKDTKYQRQSLYLLTNAYPRLSVRAIEVTFKKECNFQFPPAFNRLSDIQAVILQADDNEDGGGGVHEVEEEDDLVRARILREAPFLENVAKILNKTTRPKKSTLRKKNLDHDLLQEMSLIPELNGLISTEGQPKEPEEALAVGEDGEPLACDCCMEDLLVTTEMVHCNASSPDGRHYFCKTCIQRHLSEQLYGKNDAGPLKCMTYTEECPNFFAEDKVASVLTPRTKANYEARLAQKAIKAVPGIDLRQCPQCGAQFDIAEGLCDLDCPECKFKSCLECQNASHPDQTCQEAEQERAQLNPGSHAENAMTAAVVRRCPNPTCKVPFQKGGKRECNKIICTCGTMSCYLCRQEIKLKQPYKHFCQTPHCTHDSCGKCVLFTDTEEDDRIARRQAKRQAKRFAKEQKARTAGHGISSPVCEARKHTKQGAPEPKRAAAAAAAAAPPVAATAPPVAAAGAPPPPRARQEQHATPPRRQRQEQPVPPLPRRRQEPQRDRDEALEQPQVEQRRRQEEAKAQQQQLRQEAAEQQRRRDADNLRRQQQEAEQQRLRQEAEEQRRLAADNLQQQPQEQAEQQRQRQEDEADNIHQQQCPCACIVL